MQFAIHAPLLDSMADGEMDKFDKVLVTQRKVPGLQEFSLYEVSSNKKQMKEEKRF